MLVVKIAASLIGTAGKVTGNPAKDIFINRLNSNKQ
jgi:hypothetical protein